MNTTPQNNLNSAGETLPAPAAPKEALLSELAAIAEAEYQERCRISREGFAAARAPYNPDGSLREEPAAPVLAKYRKGTLEAKLDSLLPDWPSFDVIAHELWGDGDGSYSVNDSWHLARGCDREEAISHLRHRWEVYKINYEPKARVSDISDDSCDSESPSLLSAGYPFAEVRNASNE